MRCMLCPRRCGADREAGERGLCGAGPLPVIARAAPHFGEEPCISGERGSGAVFFSGCALGCSFCQNVRISQGSRYGIQVTERGLGDTLRALIDEGVHNLNLVTATPYLPMILRVLDTLPSIPIVWNSGGYELPETMALLEGRRVVFLPDWKYADASLANDLSKAADYPDIAFAAIQKMVETAGAPLFDAEGMMVGGVLVRHLVLPGHLDNTRRVLDEFTRHFRGKALLSLMGQYTPPPRSKHLPKPMQRPLTQKEYDGMVEYALALGLEDVFIQELSSADPAQTPSFDGTGVIENLYRS